MCVADARHKLMSMAMNKSPVMGKGNRDTSSLLWEYIAGIRVITTVSCTHHSVQGHINYKHSRLQVCKRSSANWWYLNALVCGGLAIKLVCWDVTTHDWISVICATHQQAPQMDRVTEFHREAPTAQNAVLKQRSFHLCCRQPADFGNMLRTPMQLHYTRQQGDKKIAMQ